MKMAAIRIARGREHTPLSQARNEAPRALDPTARPPAADWLTEAPKAADWKEVEDEVTTAESTAAANAAAEDAVAAAANAAAETSQPRATRK
jgi:hypothetical protein